MAVSGSFILRTRSFSHVRPTKTAAVSESFRLKDGNGQFREVSKHDFIFRPNEMDVLKVKGLPFLAEMGGVQGIAAALRSDVKLGLSTDEVESKEKFEFRENLYNRNYFPKPPLTPFLQLCYNSLKDPMLIVLMFAGAISIILNSINDPSHGWVEGLAILMAVILVSTVSSVNDYRKELQFRELEKEDIRTVQVVRGGVASEINADDIQVGDVAVLAYGDRIPADGIYIHGVEASVDEASLTGETEAVKKNFKNFLFYAGTNILEGEAVILIIAVGKHSEWGKICEALSEERADTPLQEKLEKMAKTIGYLGTLAAVLLAMALLGFYIWDASKGYIEGGWFGQEGVNRLLLTLINACTIVVVAVPEGLPLAVTISLAYSMKKMVYDKNFVRHLHACETMGNATAICSDKTGTLTQNLMTVERAWVGGKSFDHRPLRSELNKELALVLGEGEILNNKCVLNPDVKEIPAEGRVPLLGDNQTAQALFRWALDILEIMNEGGYSAIREEHPVGYSFPFNSANKMGGVIVWNPESKIYRFFIKGAYERILAKCTHFINSNGEIEKLTESTRTQIIDDVTQMATKGLRCVCQAYRDYSDMQTAPDGTITNAPPLSDASNLIAISVAGIRDPLRPEVPEAVRRCHEAGVIVRMVTGDHLETAKYIARDCHILTNSDQIAIEGGRFRTLSEEEKEKIIPNLRVLARSSPFDKQELVRWLKSKGEVVAVTGDGTNDAAALKEADVGLSMGIQGTDVAKNSSDIIIMDDNFSSIVKSLMWGRSVYDNIRKFLQFQLTVNVVALTISLAGVFAGMDPPLKAVQLLWVNLIMDTLAALALGTEIPTLELLKRRPYKRDSSLISRIMWRNILGMSAYQLVILSIFLWGGDIIFDVELTTTHHFTLVFNVFVFMQLFNEINSKKVNNEWNVFSDLHTNSIFLLIMFITIILQIFMVELFGDFAKTEGLNIGEWFICIGFASTTIIANQLIRLVPVDLSFGFIDIDIKKEFYEDPNFYISAPEKPRVAIQLDTSRQENEEEKLNKNPTEIEMQSTNQILI